MSTCNFETMENFPLFVWEMDTPSEKFLKDNDMDEEEYRYWEYEIKREQINSLIEDEEKNNNPLMFHKIEIADGYYSGLQLLVKDDNDGYGIPEEHDNESCHVIWGMCRSKAIREYEREINRIKRMLKRIAKGAGLIEIECIGVFSNGEAVYSIVQ